ncbi:MAG: hypothetical protein IT371_03125 [Deltaproteobacteria bacterium]|nr:hypothetical protein [Deltaproteobacteria bacterium]
MTFLPRLATCGAILLLLGCGETPSGQRCTTNEQCQAPAICAADGRCVAPSELLDEGKSCAGDAACKTKLCGDVGAGKVCLLACEASASCGEGRLCLPSPVQGSAEKTLRFVCQKGTPGERFLDEACAGDAQCASGLCEGGRCTEACGTCPEPGLCEQRTVTRSQLTVRAGLCRFSTSGEVLELGAVPTPVGGSAPVTFEVSARHGAFILFGEDKQGLRVAVKRLVGPDGTVVVDAENAAQSLARPSIDVSVGTVLVPGTDHPKAQLRAGRYQATFATYDPAQPDKLAPVAGQLERVAVVLRPRLLDGGTVDLALHFAPSTGLKAATAESDPQVQQLLSRFDQLYRQLAGLALGEVSYGDLTAAENEVSSGAQAQAICSKYSKPGPRGLSVNLYLVGNLTFAGGFAGGIPGAPGVFGGPGSGIVLKKQGTPQGTGTLAAHEVGHFLGLWHTTESNGASDPVSDTPSCPTGTQIKDCPDYRNLMFPFFPTSDPLSLTEGQVRILRASPWLAQSLYPDVCGKGIFGVDASRGFATGTLEAASALAGSCGGGQRGERVHLYRLETAGLKALEVTVNAVGFAPVAYVRQGSCADRKTELACKVGAAGAPLVLSVPSPKPGPYFVVVDGADGAGRYQLALRQVK